jgi:hypothetical protein
LAYILVDECKTPGSGMDWPVTAYCYVPSSQIAGSFISLGGIYRGEGSGKGTVKGRK